MLASRLQMLLLAQLVVLFSRARGRTGTVTALIGFRLPLFGFRGALRPFSTAVEVAGAGLTYCWAWRPIVSSGGAKSPLAWGRTAAGEPALP